MTAKREVKEGKQYQGIEEEIAYTITTTPWGSSPTSITAKVFSLPDNGVDSDIVDTTTDNMPSGSPSASGDVITLPVLKSLVLDTMYRVEVKFTCSGNIFEAYAYVKAER